MTNSRRCFYDCEFLEDGRTIALISIGIIDQDGREYYAVNELAPWDRIAEHQWLMENVVPSLPQATEGSPPNPCGVDLDDPVMRLPGRIADDVRAFLVGSLAETRPPELWAWYGAYDHVVLSQLWGPMIDHPDGVPMWTNDLRQWQHQLGDPWLPEQPESLVGHNALDDARYNADRWLLLALIDSGRITIEQPTDAGAAAATE